MTSIGFLAQKGGAGKTTLAVHLAVLAGDALMIDFDPQRLAAKCWVSRASELPELAMGEARDHAGALAATKRHRESRHESAACVRQACTTREHLSAIT